MMKFANGYIRSIDVAEHRRDKAERHLRHAPSQAGERAYHDGIRMWLITLTETGHGCCRQNARPPCKTPTAFPISHSRGVDAKTAEEDACKIEHDISQQTYDAICSHARANLQPKR